MCFIGHRIINCNDDKWKRQIFYRQYYIEGLGSTDSGGTIKLKPQMTQISTDRFCNLNYLRPSVQSVVSFFKSPGSKFLRNQRRVEV